MRERERERAKERERECSSVRVKEKTAPLFCFPSLPFFLDIEREIERYRKREITK